MPEPRELTEEGIEHLQRAGRELLGAARSFLDAVEGVVEDRERLAGLAEGIGGALTEAVGALRPLGERLVDPDRPRPWEAAATEPSGAGWPPDPDPAEPADVVEPDPARAAAAVPVEPDDPEPDDPQPEMDGTVPDAAVPGRSEGDRSRARARVRRIPVD